VGVGATRIPTPCTQVTVQGVLEHMIAGATMFTAAYRGHAAPEPDLRDVLAGIGPSLQALGDAINAPGALDRTIASTFGPMSGEAFARYIVLDGLVHGWDLATATDQPYDPRDQLVDAADAYARQTLDPLRVGETFADGIDAPADASPIERLAAYTGRRL
jgi:uncharacterized protein (TIGR03086 family)